jgi:hypothetical protein
VLLGGELIHDLALGELSLDGLLVVGFDDDPWSPLHDRTSFPRYHSACLTALKPG